MTRQRGRCERVPVGGGGWRCEGVRGWKGVVSSAFSARSDRIAADLRANERRLVRCGDEMVVEASAACALRVRCVCSGCGREGIGSKSRSRRRRAQAGLFLCSLSSGVVSSGWQRAVELARRGLADYERPPQLDSPRHTSPCHSPGGRGNDGPGQARREEAYPEALFAVRLTLGAWGRCSCIRNPAIALLCLAQRCQSGRSKRTKPKARRYAA